MIGLAETWLGGPGGGSAGALLETAAALARPGVLGCDRAAMVLRPRGARTDDEYRRPLCYADSSSASLILRRRTHESAETTGVSGHHAPLRDARPCSRPTAQRCRSLPTSAGIPSCVPHGLCARNVRTNCPGKQEASRIEAGSSAAGTRSIAGQVPLGLATARFERRIRALVRRLDGTVTHEDPNLEPLIPPTARMLPLAVAFP